MVSCSVNIIFERDLFSFANDSDFWQHIVWGEHGSEVGTYLECEGTGVFGDEKVAQIAGEREAAVEREPAVELLVSLRSTPCWQH